MSIGLSCNVASADGVVGRHGGALSTWVRLQRPKRSSEEQKPKAIKDRYFNDKTARVARASPIPLGLHRKLLPFDDQG